MRGVAEEEVRHEQSREGSRVESSEETRAERGVQSGGANAQTRDEAQRLRGTRWEARCYIETAPRRVRVVAMATRTQPRRGAHLAPLTPLIRADHARNRTTRAT